MLTSTFITEFQQSLIPVGFHIRLEGQFIALIGKVGTGKTALLHALFRKNVSDQIAEKTQVCLIDTTITDYTPHQPRGRTLEQYNTELAKVIGRTDGRHHWPNADELPMLLLKHSDFNNQVLKLNKYLGYLDLPKIEMQEAPIDFTDQLHTIFRQPGIPYLLAILAALTDDSIKMVLIDNPETYLHPTLQKKLRDLLYAASKEKQIIITTHSNVFMTFPRFGGVEKRGIYSTKGGEYAQATEDLYARL